MTWQLWIVVGLFLANAVTQPLIVGKPDRSGKKTTPIQAVASTIFYLLCGGLVIWGAS